MSPTSTYRHAKAKQIRTLAFLVTTFFASVSHSEDSRIVIAPQALSNSDLLVSPSEIAPYFLPRLKAPSYDKQKAALGKRLFHDPMLSVSRRVSCASCHILTSGGDDNLPSSFGVSGHPTSRNSPTVIYAAFHIAQFWDGRVATLEEQVDGPILHPDEMGSNWDIIENRLRAHSEYAPLFKKIYGAPPNRTAIRNAIAEFERTLVFTNSAFDKFLDGDTDAMSLQARAGAQRFISFGCVSCHQGPLLGANMYQKIGVFKTYYGAREDADLGRYNVTKNERDKYFFKVPSLRNVAETAPYFHDGSIPTLEGAVDMMALHQLGRKLSHDDRVKLVAFLRALSDEQFQTKLQKSGDE